MKPNYGWRERTLSKSELTLFAHFATDLLCCCLVKQFTRYKCKRENSMLPKKQNSIIYLQNKITQIIRFEHFLAGERCGVYPDTKDEKCRKLEFSKLVKSSL